jgi:hypothetical protein
MSTPWRPFASYNLWLQFAPPVGQERWHCDMKRGFTKARNKEASIATLLNQDNIPQRIGILAQRGVYELAQESRLFSSSNAVEKVAEILQLNQEAAIVQARVIAILRKYYADPILINNSLVKLSRGDEGFPEPILIKHGNYQFNLYAAIDCIFREADGKLHILDFKTGISEFDKRQAYVYLLAASYLYPQQIVVASFYNLESGKFSDLVTATSSQLYAIQIELVRIAQQHQKDLRRYRYNPKDFKQIFPASPGFNCCYCPFNSICEFAISKVPA